MPITLASTARNAACNAVVDLVDVGTGDATLLLCTSGGSPLVTIVLDVPAFDPASVGVTNYSNLSLSGVATSTGTLGKYIVNNRNDDTVWSGSIGTSGADLIVDATSIVASQHISITGWSHTHPA